MFCPFFSVMLQLQCSNQQNSRTYMKSYNTIIVFCSTIHLICTVTPSPVSFSAAAHLSASSVDFPAATLYFPFFMTLSMILFWLTRSAVVLIHLLQELHPGLLVLLPCGDKVYVLKTMISLRRTAEVTHTHLKKKKKPLRENRKKTKLSVYIDSYFSHHSNTKI